jgi:hypothetical protein
VGADAGRPQDLWHHIDQAGLAGEGQGGVVAVPVDQVVDCPAAHGRPLVVGQRQRRHATPECVGHPPPVRPAGDERHAVEGAAEIDRRSERGGRQAVVGAAEIGHHGQHVAPLGSQRLEDVFPQVVTGHVVPDAGGQLGHRRPPAGVVEPSGGKAPAGGELGQLVVREAQVVFGHAQDRTLGGQAGEGHGRRPTAGQQDVTVGGQCVD